MNSISQFFLILCFSAMVFVQACSSKKDEKTEKVLAEARTAHNDAMKIHDEIMPQMKSLKEYTTQVSEKITELQASKDTTSQIKSLEALKASLEKCRKSMMDWMGNIREVPGEEGHEHNHEGHDHSHEANPNATPEEILAYQVEMKKNVELIKQDFEKALNEAKTMLEKK
jgi:ABC-type nickel/cobalt efflux system permease component RcnA